MPTFGSTSAAITLSFDFDIVYSSERIINNSFFSFQCSCVNVCKLMEIWIAAHLSRSGCVREGCCPSHMSPATPVCPVGMLWCPRGVRCHPHHALWTGTAGPLTMDKGCAHMGPWGLSALCLEVDNLCGHLCGPGHVWGHITWRNGPWTSGGAVTLSTKGTTPTCWIFSAASLGCCFPAIRNNTAAKKKTTPTSIATCPGVTDLWKPLSAMIEGASWSSGCVIFIILTACETVILILWGSSQVPASQLKMSCESS